MAAGIVVALVFSSRLTPGGSTSRAAAWARSLSRLIGSVSR